MSEYDQSQHDQFLRFFLREEEDLRLFVRSLLFSHEEARDVMQDVAVVLWRKFDSEMDGPAFRRWAFGVARMEVLSFRRDCARDRHVFGDELLELLAETVEEGGDKLAAQRSALEICLQKLPDSQRDFVVAAYAPGVRIDVYARELGRTAMAVYKNLHRIRITLMECTQRLLASEELELK